MCNCEKIMNYDLAPAKKTDNLMQDLGKEQRVMLKGLITIKSDGAISVFGIPIKRGKR